MDWGSRRSNLDCCQIHHVYVPWVLLLIFFYLYFININRINKLPIVNQSDAKVKWTAQNFIHDDIDHMYVETNCSNSPRPSFIFLLSVSVWIWGLLLFDSQIRLMNFSQIRDVPGRDDIDRAATFQEISWLGSSPLGWNAWNRYGTDEWTNW